MSRVTSNGSELCTNLPVVSFTELVAASKGLFVVMPVVALYANATVDSSGSETGNKFTC